MHLGDYDHDGRATEFVLQIGSTPCGHRQSILVGIDRIHTKLHVFATPENPGNPIILEHPENWEKLRKSNGKVAVIETPCGDHASDKQEELNLYTDKNGIHATSCIYSCNEDRKGKLLKKEPYPYFNE